MAVFSIGRQGLLHSYRRHEAEILGFLTNRLRCAVTAADLAQDLYLRLLLGQHPERIQRPRAYLFRMAANLATDHQREETRRHALETECQSWLYSPTEDRTPEREVAGRAELAALRQAVTGLPDRSRYIFYQNRFRGRTQAEIAADLGVSTTTVEKHMRRVMAALAEARHTAGGAKAE